MVLVTNLLDPVSLTAAGPYGQVKAIERSLWHLGFDDVRVIDGSGDDGADILAVKNEEEWVFQSKWSLSGSIDRQGADDVERAHRKYVADHAVLVTNTMLSTPAQQRIDVLRNLGFRIDVWNGATLDKIGNLMPEVVTHRHKLRKYQERAVNSLNGDLQSTGRALLILATGLGKTVVGGEVIAGFLIRNPKANVLVLSHLKELSAQLERAMWQHLPKSIRTHLLTGETKPLTLNGVTVATIESALNRVYEGYIPDLIMVDETHHVGQSGMYADLLQKLGDVPRFGVTATPWRGDEFDISTSFGPPSFTMGIAEGMRDGWLSEVDYRLFVDNIDWETVQHMSKHGYSIKELNRKLFIPQRDSEIIDKLRDAWNKTLKPRAILFCETIDHAQHMETLLQSSDPAWSNAKAIHSALSKQQRNIILNHFRLGRIPILTCVDVLNEGVDVPDVNLIAFLRVTHSRRIFVQQLGRGLRLAKGKRKLKVLDFVTDIRRVAAALQLRRDLENGEKEIIKLPNSIAAGIQFSDATTGKLLDMWIADAADIESAADDVRLQFPEPVGF